MRLTDERITFLSHHIVKVIIREKLINQTDEAALSQETKKMIIKFLKEEELVDQKIRTKISSIKRGIPEGSREWDVLYEQYYSEEMTKMVR